MQQALRKLNVAVNVCYNKNVNIAARSRGAALAKFFTPAAGVAILKEDGDFANGKINEVRVV